MVSLSVHALDLIGRCRCGARSWLPVGGTLHFDTQHDPDASPGHPETLRLLAYRCADCTGVTFIDADMAARRLGHDEPQQRDPLRVVDIPAKDDD